VTATIRVWLSVEPRMVWWTWCSKRPTFMSSLTEASSNNSRCRMEAWQILECLVAPTTTRWTDSALRSRSVKISTLSSLQMPRIRVLNSRLSTTSWSRRSNSITTKWCSRTAKTVSRCWTREAPVASPTSCSHTTTSKWCSRLTMETPLFRTVSRRPSQLTRNTTTSMSTASRGTPSIRQATYLSSKIDQ